MVWWNSLRLKSSSPRARRKAIEGLALAGDLNALKLLIASLNDEDPLVRCAGAKALGTFIDSESVAALVAALDDVNGAVRKYIDPAKISVVKAGDFKNKPPKGITP